MPAADGGRVEAAAGPQHARELCQGAGPIGDVVEDVVRDRDVQARVLERQLVHVGDLRLGLRRGRPRSLEHPGRTVGQGDVPAGRNPLGVLAPELPHAASDLQHSRVVVDDEPVEHPALPGLWIGREAPVELDPRAEVLACRILPVEPPGVGLEALAQESTRP